MSFSSEVSKLLTNKYFLYLIVFIAATNVLGYLVNNKLNAVIFFALISLLSYQFSKNMAIVLLIAIVATNFMMSSKIIREGLETQSDSSLDKVDATDPEIANAIPAVASSSSNEEATAKLNSKDKEKENDTSSGSTTLDINNADLNKVVKEDNSPEGFGEKLSNNKKGKSDEHFGPRLDYAATIEQSYQNLDEILGSESIQKLSQDTQKLMAQQQNLFNTMNQMVPVLEGAQNMLKGFDVGSLTNSLKGLSALGNSAATAKKPTTASA